MDFVMGALGVRGVLLDGGHDGPTLAAKSDAMAVRTSTDAVSGSGGNLEASQADVTRVRFALEGSRPFGLGGDAVLTRAWSSECATTAAMRRPASGRTSGRA